MPSASEAIYQSELTNLGAFYHSLVESLPQNILRKDLEGRFTFANQRFCSLVGKPLREIVGKTDSDLFPAHLAAKYQEDDRTVITRGEGYETIEEHLTATGDLLFVQVIKTPIFNTRNEILGVQCIFWDITAHQQAEEALRQSEERFRLLFEQAPVAYHEIDAKGVVTRVNRAECVLLGYEAGEMVGRHISDFTALEEQAASREAVRRKVAEEQPLAVFERDYVRRDGTRLILEIHENLIRDRKGAVTGIRSSLLDITERKRTEESLARQTCELARSNVELEQFAYVASHDLQEPLRKIQTFGDLLKRKCAEALTDQGRDYLARMQNAAGRMQTLIDDLLTLSRVRTKKQRFAAVDLAVVTQGVLSDLEVRIKHLGAQLEVTALPVIHADPVQMSQLVQNLIGNALKFHRKDQPPRVKVHGCLLPNEEPVMYQLIVEDDGIGFDEKYLDRIFQVFQRLHGRDIYEGTGVGLAVCRHIAQRHGGSITATSALGRGSRFVVTLPVEQRNEREDLE